jgi:hypothetical protein
MARVEYRDQNLEDMQLELDGNTFTGCTIANCRLTFRATGKPVVFSANHLSGNYWNFEDGALRTVQFLAAMYQNGGPLREMVEKVIHAIRKGPPKPR